MKNQTKKVLIALFTTITIITGSLLGITLYGTQSDAAKGFTNTKVEDRNFAFSNEYQYRMIDPTGVVDEVVAEYIPPKNFSTEEGKINGKPAHLFVDQFMKEHDGQEPVFQIKTRQFNFDNRYIAAVSLEDWSAFVFWYIGDETHKGHLSYGPEAGSITTFEIVSGVEWNGAASTLGARTMIHQEVAKITFYPDAFFGSMKLYDRTKARNDLIFKLGDNSQTRKGYTIEEINQIVEVVNSVNKHNSTPEAQNKFDTDKINYYLPKDKRDDQDNPLQSTVKERYGEFGLNKKNSLSPYYIEEESVGIENGKLVPYYNIYFELIPSNNGEKESLIQKVGNRYPTLKSAENGPHFIKHDDGTFSVEDGSYKIVTPDKTISIPQVISTLDPDFKGVGFDFLKYVGLHEYGHHLTMSQVQDLSEGGINLGAISSIATDNMNLMFNFDYFNSYLKQRTNNLRVERANAYGQLWNGIDDPSLYELPKFIVGNETSYTVLDIEDFTGHRKLDGTIDQNFPYFGLIEHINNQGDGEPYLKDMIAKFNAEPCENGPDSTVCDLTLNEVFIMNSSDEISGTFNPSPDIGFYQKKDNDSYASTNSLFDPFKKAWRNPLDIIKELKDGNGQSTIFKGDYVVAPDKDEEYKYFNILDIMPDPSKNWSQNSVKDEYAWPKDNGDATYLELGDPLTVLNSKGQPLGSGKDGYAKLKELVRVYLAKFQTLNWKIYQDHSSLSTTNPRPEVTEMIYSDYVYNFPEILTRDYLQTIFQTATEKLRNSGEFISVYNWSSGLNYYIDGAITSEYRMNGYEVETFKNFVTQQSVIEMFTRSPLTDSEVGALSTDAQAQYAKLLDKAKTWPTYFFNSIFLNNDFLGKPVGISNGLEVDRQQKEGVGAGLYSELVGVGNKNYVTGSTHTTADAANNHGASAYWEFLKGIYGIGDRTLSGLFREKDSDAVFMYGYINKDDKDKVKYLAFENEDTGEVKYIPITSGSLVGNLFYLEQQSNSDTIHTLEDDGYIPWTTNMFTVGQFVGEDIEMGGHEVYFTDSNHNKVETTNRDGNAISLLSGNRSYICENGKKHSLAPSFFQDINGKEEYIVEQRFNA